MCTRYNLHVKEINKSKENIYIYIYVRTCTVRTNLMINSRHRVPFGNVGPPHLEANFPNLGQHANPPEAKFCQVTRGHVYPWVSVPYPPIALLLLHALSRNHSEPTSSFSPFISPISKFSLFLFSRR